MAKLTRNNLKRAEKEVQFWQRKAEKEEKRVQRETEAERLLKQIEEERKIYGGSSAREFLQHIDRRASEIADKMREYEYNRMVSFCEAWSTPLLCVFFAGY